MITASNLHSIVAASRTSNRAEIRSRGVGLGDRVCVKIDAERACGGVRFQRAQKDLAAATARARTSGSGLRGLHLQIGTLSGSELHDTDQPFEENVRRWIRFGRERAGPRHGRPE